MLVLRPSEVCLPGGACTTIYQILLLHKPRKKDAWQLPQGGVEGDENVTEAALRELKEEAGLDGCRVLGVSERVYQYDFPESFRRFRPDNVKGQRIEYVFALAPKDAIVTVD
ncbi:MAG: NUDIX domain-containing protein, partial [Candidatus Peribacteraceae bacterium]|nr:NUDIX domain-containing protein [Candidatus Peribacteraceae bacterium]